MAEIICRPFITLKNGKRLYAWEKGLKAFCFTANPDYEKKIPPLMEEDSNQKLEEIK